MKQTILHLIEKLPDDDRSLISLGICAVAAIITLLALTLLLWTQWRIRRLDRAVCQRFSVGESVIKKASLIAFLALLSGCIPAPAVAAVCETNYGAERGEWVEQSGRAAERQSDTTDTAPLDGMLRFYFHEISTAKEVELWIGLGITLLAILGLMMFSHVQGYKQGRKDEHFLGAGDREIARRARGESPEDVFPPKPAPGIYIGKPDKREEDEQA